MNIGHWIIVSFVLFACFIGILVTMCMREDISLVSDNYYQEELAYQHQIERMQNTANLKSKPSIKIVADQLHVQFENYGSVDHGELKLFCPANSKQDRHFKLSPSQENIQVFDVGTVHPGTYKARLNWSMNGKEYYQEETVHL
jgi:hypothetical protein